jgi:S-adenosylmethionine uptake transporter
MHLWRTLVGVISLTAWFYALAHLSIATAMTLNYMSSIWLTCFIMLGALFFGSALQTKHHGLQAPLVITVLAGFVGVLLVLRPAFEQGQELAGLVGLLSGFVAAFAYLQVTTLARLGEPEVRTVFYFALGTVFMGAGSMTITGTSSWPGWPGAIWLVPIGLLASLGQVCMTRAYSSGATLLVANLQYSGIVFSVLFGLFLFNDAIPLLAWMGMALIIASGITATILRHRANVATATPEPAEEF